MYRLIFAIAAIFIIFCVKNEEAATSAVAGSKNQNVTIKRFTNMLSSFLTYGQYCTLSNQFMGYMIDGQTLDQMKSEAPTAVMAVLNSSQYATGMSKATTLMFSMGTAGLTTALNKLMTVMSNNLTPFFDQCVNYTSVLQAQGMKDKGVEKNIYRVINSFMSKKRVKTIFTRVSLQYSSSDWSKLKSALTGIINFNKLES